MKLISRLSVALSISAAVLLAGCGAATVPSVPGSSHVDTPASVVVTPAPDLTTQATFTPLVTQVPDVQIPNVQAPDIQVPNVQVPDVQIPTHAVVVPPAVPAPIQPAPPAGATAKCKDGTYSFSQHHSGTCSHHDGVAEWLV